jgi:hypothetical protein
MQGAPARVWRIGVTVSVIGAAGASLALSSASGSSRSHLVSDFHLKGSHHYRISVEARRAQGTLFAKGKRHLGKLTVTASKDTGSATYTVPAKFNRRRIRANLGRFGKVALKVKRQGGFWLPPAKAAAEQRRIGVCYQGGAGARKKFRGVFRFRGEGGYTRTETHQVVVDVFRTGPIRCTGHDHGTKLKAVSESTRFVALLDTGYQASFLHASTKEHVGEVRIDRDAYRAALADAGEFTFDSGLTSAHVMPAGAPFSGLADYASPRSWTGSLEASFPGQGNVPLTGPGFDVTLKTYLTGD